MTFMGSTPVCDTMKIEKYKERRMEVINRLAEKYDLVVEYNREGISFREKMGWLKYSSRYCFYYPDYVREHQRIVVYADFLELAKKFVAELEAETNEEITLVVRN